MSNVDILLRPLTVKSLTLRNRVVMAPMSRHFSPAGVPGDGVAAYYARRAAHGVGLVITEGTYIAHPTAGNEGDVPRIAPGAPLAAWRGVCDAVHAAGGRIFCQLWHIGLPANTRNSDPAYRLVGPSGVSFPPGDHPPMTDADIAEILAAFGESARCAREAGFDGVEVHAAHGYLIDQFFWARTNRRADRWGGDLVERTRFGVEVVRACRAAVGPDYPIGLRYSQWKIAEYDARLATTPDELDRFLAPLVDAGVDIFHCSTRRFWEPEFAGSPLNLAGWTRKLTGVPTISVGSVTLDHVFTDRTAPAAITGIDQLTAMMERGDFDLIAVGRALIANPNWLDIVKRGALNELTPFVRDVHRATLV